MSTQEQPAAPQRKWPDATWAHHALHTKVREALASLPIYFRSETHIAGIPATDIHTLNTALGASIEDQAVRTLNAIRHVWDPEERYALYSFVRQSQTFPDVLLRRASDGDILLGIELKGWYLLSKEAEPSYRFYANPAACNPWDLIVVVPWALAQVISGTPTVFEPFIESATFAAEYRNYWWQHVRKTASDTTIIAATAAHPYPTKSEPIDDRAQVDDGGNFGRFARTGLMDEYKRQMKSLELCGVRVEHWLSFFKAFQESATEDEIRSKIENLSKRIGRARTDVSAEKGPLIAILGEIEKMIGPRK